jgi:hypothetical protein
MPVAAPYTPVREALERVAHDRPFDAARLLLAGLLGLVGMAAVAMWSSTAFTAYDAFAARFERAGVPGEVVVQTVPASYYVYAEGPDAASLPTLHLRVTGPRGGAVPVHGVRPGGVAYEYTGPGTYTMGNVVASFPATEVGRYQVLVTDEGFATQRFAVGRTPYGSGATWLRVNRWGMAALWLVVVAVSLWILFAPVVPHGRRGRERRISLLMLFLGVPAALVAATVWTGFAVPQTPTHGSRGVQGWQAVLYGLPGWLLVVGVASASLVFAAVALRARAPGARWSLWLSGLGLVLVLDFFVTNVADALRPPG